MRYTPNPELNYFAVMRTPETFSGYSLEYLNLTKWKVPDFDEEAKEILRSRSLDRVLLFRGIILCCDAIEAEQGIKSGELKIEDLHDLLE